MRVIGKTIEEEVGYTRRLFERVKRWGEIYRWTSEMKRAIGIRLLDRLCVLQGILRREELGGG